MVKRIFLSTFALLAGAGIFLAGCESMTEPETAGEESIALEESFDISAMENQASLLKAAGANLDSANGFFLLRWNEAPAHLQNDNMLRGHASSVVFAAPSIPRDFTAAGLDMGSVAVAIGSDKFDLRKIVNALSGVRYGESGGGPRGPRGGVGGPHGGQGGPHGGRPEIVNIPFVAGGNYQFEITGSDQVAAMKLDITALAQLVKITGFTDGQKIDIARDLLVTWEGESTANDMVLVLGPMMKRGRSGGAGQRVQPFVQRLNAADGGYTIAAQVLQDLVSASGAEALSLRLSQGVHREINDANIGKIFVTAGSGDCVRLAVK